MKAINIDINGSVLIDTDLGFSVWVVCSKEGKELSDDYLGCCLYESFGDFIEDEYCKDMIKECMAQIETPIIITRINEMMSGSNYAKDTLFCGEKVSDINLITRSEEVLVRIFELVCKRFYTQR